MSTGELSRGTVEESGFQAYVQARRVEVELALARCLTGAGWPPVVAEAMRYSVEAGGKRLRPVLALAAADAVGGASGVAAAMPAACAIELIHTYSLVHDDLPAMDDDTLRRGRPTSHVVFGEGLAILAGDGLLTEAFALLASPDSGGADAARRLRAIGIIARAAGAGGMVGGQAVDLAAAGSLGRPPAAGAAFDAERVRAMHAMKTGALIRAAATSGAVLGGGTDEAVEAIDQFASDLGLAFQIVDDILDVEGAAADLGKSAGKDAAAGKPTYPALYGLERSRELADEALARASATLANAGLAATPLAGFIDWVGRRRS